MYCFDFVLYLLREHSATLTLLLFFPLNSHLVHSKLIAAVTIGIVPRAVLSALKHRLIFSNFSTLIIT